MSLVMPTVVTSMQAVGMVNDHQTTCFRHKAVRDMARP
ncbi:DNA-3-methyladenine glycosylase I [Brevundimonas sp. M20]|nr:DNA-3-methyladenine glycosylase I [Brevundimonas sp. M20]QDH72817.1 DNA-3-methyladenine glycosylase I [Brevundimonas sp. M20]